MAEYNLGPFRIRPRGEFNPSENYRFLDLVTYNGGSFVCINMDTVDGTAAVGILPEGESKSQLYWQCIAHKGDKGDIGGYQNFIKIEDGIWDYSESDKIIIPDECTINTLDITNVYNGCCGIVLTNKDLELPVNSEFSIDYNYATCNANQYYIYTFIYGSYITENNKFIWNRTVVNT